METVRNIILFVSALFPIVDPLGGSPIFLSLTREYRPAARRTLSRQIAINSFFLLVGSYLIGTHILAFFGISLPAVQVGGGLIVISTGWTLLKRRDEDERDRVHPSSHHHETSHQAFYPLRIRGPAGANAGSDGRDRDRAADVVSFSLHRCPDCLERGQRVLGLRTGSLRSFGKIGACTDSVEDAVQIIRFHATHLWRAHSTLVATEPKRSHECERGTQDCVRYGATS